MEAWQAGESQVIWPVLCASCRNLSKAAGTLYPVPAVFGDVRRVQLRESEPAGWQPLQKIFASGRPRRKRSTKNGMRKKSSVDSTEWRAAGTVAQPWAHDDELEAPTDPPAGCLGLAGPMRAGLITMETGCAKTSTAAAAQVAIFREDSRPELAAVMARVARDLASVGIILSIQAPAARRI